MQLFFSVLHLLLVATIALSKPTETPSPVIKTPYGLVQGYTDVTPNGKQVDVYLGIPFAGPPLGEFRFKPAPPLKPWENILNATKQPPTCYQKKQPLADVIPVLDILAVKTPFSEDCLYLNVWVPKNTKQTSESKLPVMVYIHGGGFSRGSVSFVLLDGQTLATEENVIVLMANYRVASLGFAFLNNSDVPGNAGLSDQIDALKWVRESISAFGGDPERVTIFGHSAGSCSVGHILLSPVAGPLFQRAIMESGGPHAYFSFQEQEVMLQNTTQLIENMECNKENVTATVECLRVADPVDILKSEPQGDYDLVYTFMPTVDGKIVVENPITALKEGRFEDKDILLGTVKDEAMVFFPAAKPFLFTFKDKLDITHDEMSEVLRSISPLSETVQIATSLLYEGGEDVSDSENVLYIGSRIIGDFVFTCPTIDVAKFASEKKNRVYMYYFPHRSSNNKWPKWTGAAHGEELPYVFGHPIHPKGGYSQAEAKLSSRMMRYWANFARTGDPNKGPAGQEEVTWPIYTRKSKEYLILAPNSTAIGRNFKEKQCAFWRDYRPQLEKIDKGRKARCTPI